jgi:hypothetical protein
MAQINISGWGALALAFAVIVVGGFLVAPDVMQGFVDGLPTLTLVGA